MRLPRARPAQTRAPTRADPGVAGRSATRRERPARWRTRSGSASSSDPADSAPRRSRSVATRRSRTSGSQLVEQRLLVELGQEREVAVDREAVLEQAAPPRSRPRTRPDAARRRPLDRRESPDGRRRRAASKPRSSSTSSKIAIRREDPLVVEPRDVGERPARPQDAARLAQGAGAVRHELEDERRHRGIELAVGERQRIGERDDRSEAAGDRRRAAGGRPAASATAAIPADAIDPDDRDVRPAP